MVLQAVNLIELKLQSNSLMGSNSNIGSVLLVELLGVCQLCKYGLESSTVFGASPPWHFLFWDFPLSQAYDCPKHSCGSSSHQGCQFFLKSFNCPAPDRLGPAFRLKDVKKEKKPNPLVSSKYRLSCICVHLVVLQCLQKFFFLICKKIFRPKFIVITQWFGQIISTQPYQKWWHFLSKV